jgi:hypothetical protein
MEGKQIYWETRTRVGTKSDLSEHKEGLQDKGAGGRAGACPHAVVQGAQMSKRPDWIQHAPSPSVL